MDSATKEMQYDVKFRKLTDTALIPIPSTSGAVGWDIHSDETVIVDPGHTKIVRTGFAIALDYRLAGLIFPRSGLAAKHGVTVLNSPGLIDPDYRGEVKVILTNHGPNLFYVKPGDRIAQLVFMPFGRAGDIRTKVVTELDETIRGAGGLGSTGV